MEDIEHYDIPIYNFPYDVEEDDEETIIDNSELRVSIQVSSTKLLLTSNTGLPPLRHHRLRGGSRSQWRTHPCSCLSLGFG
jgi:hypothetical protein